MIIQTLTPNRNISLILLASIFTVALSLYITYDKLILEKETKFESEVSDIKENIARQMDSDWAIARSFQGFFQAGSLPNSQSFRKFTNISLSNINSIYLVAYSDIVSRESRKQYEEKRAVELAKSNFEIFFYNEGKSKRAPDTAILHPINYLEPAKDTVLDRFVGLAFTYSTIIDRN